MPLSFPRCARPKLYAKEGKREPNLRWIFFAVFALAAAGIFAFSAAPAKAALYNATNLLGQVDQNGNPVWTKSFPNNSPASAPNGLGFDFPADVAVDTTNGRLFVADYNNNRVLAFSIDANDNLTSSTAIFVLGQSDFGSNHSAAGWSGFHSPTSLSYDSTNSRLFVSDNGNNRVMVFNVPSNATSSINGEDALFELGQTNFISSIATTSQSGFNFAFGLGLAYDPINTRLFVSDELNRRVMAFSVPGSATSSINGESALFELGQSDFTHSNTSTPTQSGLSVPYGLAYDASNTRLFVSDAKNRVMAFNVPGSATSSINGESALFELGQSDFTHSNTSTPTQSGLFYPSGLAYDASSTRLFVSDANNRVMAFSVPGSATSSANGESALFELGQADFTSNDGGSTTQSGLATALFWVGI